MELSYKENTKCILLRVSQFGINTHYSLFWFCRSALPTRNRAPTASTAPSITDAQSVDPATCKSLSSWTEHSLLPPGQGQP